MADISKITPPGSQTTYNLKDATARTATQWLDKLNGSKNLISVYTFESASMNADIQSDGCTVRVHGTGSGVDLTYGTFTVPETGEYSALISIRSGTVTSLYLRPSSGDSFDLKDVTTPTSMGTLTQGTVYELKTWTGTGATVDFTVSILICKTGVLESGLTDFRPPTLSNTKITPELIELVDSGAKNILKVAKDTISALNNGTWIGNVFTPAGQTGLTLTVSDDGTITTNGTPSAGVYIVFTTSLSLTVGETYVLSGCTGGSASTYGIYEGHQGIWDNYDGGTEKVYDSSITTIYLFVRASTNVTGKIFKPMICSKAAWDVSQKFVPYRPTYEETVEQVAENENNILSKIGASDYATQNTGGTVRVWTTTSGGETTLHIANEAPTP